MNTPEKHKERNFLEATFQNAEAFVDLVMDNDAVKAVPVVGTAFKICKGLDDLRSKSLAAKLARFLTDPALQAEKIKEKLRDSLATSVEECQKIGEVLFLVLERMTDLDKPSVLAKVFASYLDGIISSAELRRLAHAIDSAFMDDLNKLIDSENPIKTSSDVDWKQALAGSGLTRVVIGTTFDELGTMSYQITELGILLNRAVRHAINLSKI